MAMPEREIGYLVVQKRGRIYALIKIRKADVFPNSDDLER